MVSCALNLGRRKLIALAFVAAALPLFGGSGACAEPAEPIGAAAWRLGDRLSLAALLFARGGQDDAVERLLSSIKPIAEAMGITIAPFPTRAATSVDTYGEVIVYLVEGGGAETGRALAAKFGKDAGLLYDAAIKSNLLLLLYEPGDDHGLGGVIRSRMSEARVPEQLWIGVAKAIDGKASQSELKDAVLKMHEAVASYLGRVGN
jgi:hypothetical protein